MSSRLSEPVAALSPETVWFRSRRTCPRSPPWRNHASVAHQNSPSSDTGNGSLGRVSRSPAVPVRAAGADGWVSTGQTLQSVARSAGRFVRICYHVLPGVAL